MIVLWIILGAIAFIALAILAWYITTYNQFMRLKNNIDESRSTIDVCLKKRFDLIPNYVETVKGYAKHEKETFTAVVNARNSVAAAPTPEAKMAAENQLTGALRQLFALAEAYPELKANTNFQELQNQLKATEDENANARKYYNATVKQWNNLVVMWPSNIIARKKGFEKEKMFEIENPEERKNVKVEF